MSNRITACLLVVFLSIGISSQVQAVPVTWTLNGVTFDDGQTATGYFNYDATTNVFDNYLISVTAGSGFPNFSYVDANSFVGNHSAGLVDFVRDDLVSYIRLSFLSSLTNAGGTVGIATGNSSWECSNCGTLRFIVAGSVTTTPVPEPGTVTLLSLGLLGLGMAARRRRSIKPN